MSPAYRVLLRWSRNIHLYVTLFGLVLLGFFAVTGFMLNHDDWFHVSETQSRTATASIPTDLLDPLDKLAVVELLRKDHAATGALDAFEEEKEEEEIRSYRVVFKGPGRRVEAVIQRADGETELTYETRGLTGLLTDLHRGQSTGREWGLVIDGLAILVLIVSVTGVVLWWSLHSRGRFGFAVILLGAAACVAVYFAYVP
jgi:hypothetical protein